jgi:hypothetical protein
MNSGTPTNSEVGESENDRDPSHGSTDREITSLSFFETDIDDKSDNVSSDDDERDPKKHRTGDLEERQEINP